MSSMYPVRALRNSGVERLDSRIASWLFVACVIGYAPVGLLGTLFDLPRELSSIPFRLIVLSASLYLLARTWRRPLPNRIGILVLFWSAYMLRLLWDWNAGLPRMEEAIVFFVGTVVLPCSALAIAAEFAADWRRTASRMLAVGFAFSVLAVASYYMGLGRLPEGTSVGGRMEFDTVNTITVGHTAVTALLAALCLSTLRLSRTRRLLLLVGAAAPIAALTLSAARGPAVALVVCTTAFAIATKRWHWIAVIAVATASVLSTADTEIANRILALLEPDIEDESTVERLSLIRNAIEQIAASPLVGGPIIDPEYLTYPHNLFLEAAMSTGIIGLLILLVLLGRAGINAWMSAMSKDYFMPLMFLQYFIAAQFSGAIWGWSALWAPLAILICRKSFLDFTRRRYNPRPSVHT